MSLLDDIIRNFGNTALAGGLAPTTARTAAARNSESNRSAQAASRLLTDEKTKAQITGQNLTNRQKEQDFKTGEIKQRGAKMANTETVIGLISSAAKGLLTHGEIAEAAGLAAEAGVFGGLYNAETMPDMKDSFTQALVEIGLDPTNEQNIGMLEKALDTAQYEHYVKEKKLSQTEAKDQQDFDEIAAGEKRAQQKGAIDQNEERRKEELHQVKLSDNEREATDLSPEAVKLQADIIKSVQKEADPTNINSNETRSYPQIIEEYARLGLPGAAELAESAGVKVQSQGELDAGAAGVQDQFAAGGVDASPEGVQAFQEFQNAQGGPAEPVTPLATELVDGMATGEEQMEGETNALVAKYKEEWPRLLSGEIKIQQIPELQKFLRELFDKFGKQFTPEEVEAMIENGKIE